ncbi:MAG: M3 family oligoendopeptidase [Anaeroplasma sp.]
MRFEDYKYERPNFEKIADRLLEIKTLIELTSDIDALKKLIEESFSIKRNYDTMTTLVYIRNSIDTNDIFYEKEMEVIQEESNKISSSDNELKKALVNHNCREELENIYGSYWFKMMELSLKTFDDSIIDLLIKESKLTTEYDKIMASAQIEFNGEINNLNKLRKYLSNNNRQTRKNAAIKINEFLKENEEKIDNIFDDLVKTRHQMAIKLGYKNFIDLGYARMGRTDYNALDVAKYRKQVLDSLVPIANDIIMQNAKKIGISKPKFYDLGLEFLDGNPTPKGNKDELVAKALKMYTEMSSETGEFFNFMIDHNLLDLETKLGKKNGGYCTYISDYQSPFIFSNFNGTSGDVDVLTHEAGHAFMAYESSTINKNPELCWPTSEACEIHSMSMEFLSYPWMELFFEDDTKKYRISHTNEALTFIPYGVCVDHFQHLVYENPNATPAERKEMWKRCEKLYTPWRDMSELEMYDKGAFWYNQSHIFQTPFYYIDYTLAQVCALEFYCDSIDNRKETWDRYVALCKLGGTKSFVDLISTVGLHNPFNEGSIDSIVKRLKPIIDSYE